MKRKGEYEIPEPRIHRHGEPCETDELPCLYEMEARKEARRAVSFQGSIHQPLPHRACGWWHVYVRMPKRRSAADRKKDAREDFRIRRTLEGSA